MLTSPDGSYPPQGRLSRREHLGDTGRSSDRPSCAPRSGLRARVRYGGRSSLVALIQASWDPMAASWRRRSNTALPFEQAPVWSSSGAYWPGRFLIARPRLRPDVPSLAEPAARDVGAGNAGPAPRPGGLSWRRLRPTLQSIGTVDPARDGRLFRPARVELDDQSHLSLAETYLVEQVPTLFLFRHGSPVARLDGLRDDDATYSWVAEQFAGANEA